MKKSKIEYTREMLLSGEMVTIMDAINQVDEKGRHIPYTRLSSVVWDLREKGFNIITLTPKEANARLGYHKYAEGNYGVYLYEKE